jgi:hypothetical protein
VELTYVLICLNSIFSTSLPLSLLHLRGLAPILWCFTRIQKKMPILTYGCLTSRDLTLAGTIDI